MKKIIVFDSTHYAIQMEKLLKGKEIAIMTIPTPRALSKSCGISICFEPEVEKEVLATLRRYPQGITGVYQVEGETVHPLIWKA